VGGGLGLLGGAGMGAAFFLPWFVLMLLMPSCRGIGKTTVSTVTGWDLVGEQVVAVLLLMPILLAAGINIGTGIARLIAPHWNMAWSRFALYWTAASLAAFFPWISNTPLPPHVPNGSATLIVLASQQQPGVFAAFAGLLVALAGTLLQQEPLPLLAPPPPLAPPWDASKDRWHRLAIGGVALVFALIFGFTTLALPVPSGVSQNWLIWPFLLLPLFLIMFCIVCCVHAQRRPALFWRVVMVLPLVLTISEFAASWGGAVNTDGRSSIISMLAYTLAALLCFAYAAFLRPQQVISP
jgi:hypothetical protein